MKEERRDFERLRAHSPVCTLNPFQSTIFSIRCGRAWPECQLRGFIHIFYKLILCLERTDMHFKDLSYRVLTECADVVIHARRCIKKTHTHTPVFSVGLQDNHLLSVSVFVLGSDWNPSTHGWTQLSDTHKQVVGNEDIFHFVLLQFEV